MSVLRKHHQIVSAIALLVTCTFSSACTAWHTTSLQPQRFSADTSPERARLTLSDGTRVTATHPVMVGDSLVWGDGSGASPSDSARGAILTGDIRKVEVRRGDALRTIGLLVGVGGVGFLAVVLIALSNMR
jgi:ferric-dicitrate binding protein FerR (iron transport regulator)